MADYIIRFNARVILDADSKEEAEEMFQDLDLGPSEDIQIDYTKPYGT
jgi:hypothetical protein